VWYILLVVLLVAFRNEDLQLIAFSVPDVVCLLRKAMLVALFLRIVESTNDRDCSCFLNISYGTEKFSLYLKSFVRHNQNLLQNK